MFIHSFILFFGCFSCIGLWLISSHAHSHVNSFPLFPRVSSHLLILPLSIWAPVSSHMISSFILSFIHSLLTVLIHSVLHSCIYSKTLWSVHLPNSSWAFLVAQMVKDLPAMQETWVPSLGWEDPSKKGMATHSSILARGIPWTEELGGLQSLGSQRVRHDWVLALSFMCFLINSFIHTSFDKFHFFVSVLHVLDVCPVSCHSHPFSIFRASQQKGLCYYSYYCYYTM